MVVIFKSALLFYSYSNYKLFFCFSSGKMSYKTPKFVYLVVTQFSTYCFDIICINSHCKGKVTLTMISLSEYIECTLKCKGRLVWNGRSKGLALLQ